MIELCWATKEEIWRCQGKDWWKSQSLGLLREHNWSLCSGSISTRTQGERKNRQADKNKQTKKPTHGRKRERKKKWQELRIWTSKMASWLKALVVNPDDPSSVPDPYGRRREMTPWSCPLTFTPIHEINKSNRSFKKNWDWISLKDVWCALRALVLSAQWQSSSSSLRGRGMTYQMSQREP